MTRDKQIRSLSLFLAACVGVLFLVSLWHGESSIAGLQALQDSLAGRHSAGAIILEQLRLPRALLGLLVGGVLGLSGATLQGYMRNPLADPGILGVSGGAALGAVCVFYTGLMQLSLIALPLGGLIGAFAAVALLMLLVGNGGVLVLLLAGAALSGFTAALTALTLNLVPSPYASFEIMHWLMGSLTDRTFTDVAICLPGSILGVALMLTTGRALDALTLGEDVATSMGFALTGWRGVQMRVVLGTALAVGPALRFLAPSGLSDWLCPTS